MEVRGRRRLDRLSDLLIMAVVRVVDRLRRGWYTRNRSRVDEWRLMAYAFNRSPPGIIGILLVLGFVLTAVVGPYLAPYNYAEALMLRDLRFRLAPPGKYGFTLGTDDYGRDLLSRMLYGARTSFMVAILVMAVGPWIGIGLGLVAGYYGGKVDEVIMRITDVFLAFPGLVLAIALSATLPGRIQDLLSSNPFLRDALVALFAARKQDAGALAYLISVVIALWVVWWPGYARLVRGSVLSARENLYVEAARALGVPTHAILVKHILPNIMGPILVYLTLDFGGVILTEAGLSFLGVGAVPPIADWGRIVYDGAQYFPNAWWLVFFPGLATLLAVLGFNLIGDTLRDILDPKTRRSIEFGVEGGPGGQD